MKKKFAGLLMFIGLCAAVSAQNTAEADFDVALTADGTGVVIKKYTGKGGAITIPATIEGMPVREIGEGAFANEEYGSYSVNTSITAVTFPNGLVKIGAAAFAYCAGLSSVVIPDSVTEIGGGAFHECYQRPDTYARPPKPAAGLTSVTLPKGLAKAGGVGEGRYSVMEMNGIFSDCMLLKTVTIPEGVQVIGHGMFSGCEALTTIVIPNSVRSIGNGAFSGSGLVSFTLGNGITLIPQGVFANCKNLQTVVIPEGIVKIDGGRSSYSQDWVGSFSGCTALTSVTLPSTIKILGAGAFKGCGALTTVTIPDSVETITFYGINYYHDGNYGAFSDCPKLNLASQAALRRRGYTTGELPEDPEDRW